MSKRYLLHNDHGRYYGWVKRPTRRSAGEMGLVARESAYEFWEVQHPSTVAKAQLEREYGSSFTIEEQQ